MQATAQAIQAIADSLGAVIPKQQAITYFSGEIEYYIQQLIGTAAIISRQTRCKQITPTHINRILESQNQQRIFGYESGNNYQLTTIAYDQVDLSFPKETQNSLESESSIRIPRSVTPAETSLVWILSEGVPIDTKALTNRRVAIKPPKVIERAVSSSSNIGNSGSIISGRDAQLDILGRSYDVEATVADVLSPELQNVFSQCLNSLNDDLLYSREMALHQISQDPCLQQLVPYFIQYIIYQLTIHLQEPKLVETLVLLAISIVRNDHIEIELFAHSFIRIGLTALVSLDMTSNDFETDYNARTQASYLLTLLCEKVEPMYPTIKKHLFNACSQAVFNSGNTFPAQYGALYCIAQLGNEYKEMIKPHLRGLINLATEASTWTQTRQAQSAIKVLALIDQYYI